MAIDTDIDSSGAREKLIDDVKTLTKDVQDLLKVTASVVGGKASEARDRVQASLKVAQDKLGTARETVKSKGSEAAVATDEYVRDNPWNAVGIAAGLGLVVGLLVAISFSGSSDDD